MDKTTMSNLKTGTRYNVIVTEDGNSGLFTTFRSKLTKIRQMVIEEGIATYNELHFDNGVVVGFDEEDYDISLEEIVMHSKEGSHAPARSISLKR